MLMELESYTQYHETKLHDQPGFSYNTYLCTIPQDFLRVDLHWHEQMEIIYVKKGSGTVTVNMTALPVSAGCLVPILPGELHAIEGTPGVRMEYENIIFSLSILESTDENDWCRTHVIRALENGTLTFPRPILPGTDFHRQAAQALDLADHACMERTSGYALLVKSSLFQFLYALYSHRYPETGRPASQHEDSLKKVILFVKEHFAEPITVEDAAAVTEYSPAHFMRFFRQETGQTFIRFLSDYRLSYASYLLKESGDPVSAVAEKSGFFNLSYFIRIFRSHFGLSPGQYRRQFQKR
jgi:AraC-like DNA-binding protein/quercetin dioxygenase-like cupin family protein